MKPTLGPKTLRFLEHLTLLVLAAFLAAIRPYLTGKGLGQMTQPDWGGVANSVMLAVFLPLAVLIGTPASRSYGLFADPSPLTTLVASPVHAAVAPPAGPPAAAPAAVPVPVAPAAPAAAITISPLTAAAPASVTWSPPSSMPGLVPLAPVQVTASAS